MINYQMVNKVPFFCLFVSILLKTVTLDPILTLLFYLIYPKEEESEEELQLADCNTCDNKDDRQRMWCVCRQ